MKYILVLDQGTTSSRAIIFNESGHIIASSQEEFRQIYPQAGYVEHDPIDILSSVRSVMSTVLTRARLKYSQISAMGITNQRETVVCWSKKTGEPLYNAIVWQCRRTGGRCDELVSLGYEEIIRKKTGLKIDSYFSATKIEWLINNVKEVKEALNNGDLLVGTIDTYVMWQLSGGKIYKTDYTNASRTMLFNIHDLCWDQELCNLFNIPVEILPEVCPSSNYYGDTDDVLGWKIPIHSVAGDQQSALFGQMCFEKGDLKVTYGTGCFLLANSTNVPVISKNGLVTSLSCHTDKGLPMYVLEGSVFVGGAVVQWLRDELKVINSSKESEEIATMVEDTNGVYLVPAFVGMGAPYWNYEAEGLITGITRGTNQSHIVRAGLESICYQVNDLVKAMEKDLNTSINAIKVDGGAVVNNFLMQFQADILNADIIRPKNVEVTALGVCYLAVLSCGIYKDLEELKKTIEIDRIFKSNMPEDIRKNKLFGWQKALKKSFVK